MGLNECDGYRLVIKTREDIINTIKKNVTDGEVMDDIIESLESSVAKSINQKKWTSIPYIGNMRINKALESCIANIGKLKAMRDIMPTSQYIVFRKQLAKEELNKIDRDRAIAWFIAKAKTKYSKLHKKLVISHGEKYANMYVYFKAVMYPVIQTEDEDDGE